MAQAFSGHSIGEGEFHSQFSGSQIKVYGMKRPAGTETAEVTQLVRRFEKPLQHYAASIIGDKDLALDVVQETFCVYDQASVPMSEATKWLFKVCRNKALNVCRRERRLLYLGDEVLEPVDEEASPSLHLEAKEAFAFLLTIVATLPLREQELLRLKFQNDLSYAEISEITNLSVSNVGFILHRALAKLRGKYKGMASTIVSFPLR